jgi:hypothetical protein
LFFFDGECFFEREKKTRARQFAALFRSPHTHSPMPMMHGSRNQAGGGDVASDAGVVPGGSAIVSGWRLFFLFVRAGCRRNRF